MRRLALLAVLGTLDLAACKHKPQARSDVFDTKETAALSELKMGDPAAEAQLIRGFYGVESGSWRWTASKFAVKLRPPDGSAKTGATLQLQFSLPEVIVNKVGPVTLSASVDGTALTPQTYSKSGEYTYSAPVPAAALGASTITAEFATDKSMPPGNGDKRELALVAVSAGLSSLIK